jgi:hypothetical protein
MTVFAAATSGQREDALHVWRAARTANGNPPSKARIDRVRKKLADTAASLLVGCDDDLAVAMALAEPYRERGAGAVRPTRDISPWCLSIQDAGDVASAAGCWTPYTGRCWCGT